MTVLDALFEVLNHQDGTLAFRFCCRAGVCGSCAMMIGGKIRLACETQIGQFIGKGDLMISPLPHQKVVKDLAVDYDHFFERMKRVKPYPGRSRACAREGIPPVPEGAGPDKRADRLHPLRLVHELLHGRVDQLDVPRPRGPD